MKHTICIAALVLIACGSLSAQEEASPVTVQIGAGFTTGTGRTGTNLDTGWNISTGVGHNFNSVLGGFINVNTSLMGVNSTTFNTLGVPGGNVSIFSATLDPIVHLTPYSRRLDLYATGGGGLFRRGFYPAAVSPLQNVSSYSVIKPGVDIGVGVAIGSTHHGKIYGEVRFEHMYGQNIGGNYYTDFLPVTFGYRW